MANIQLHPNSIGLLFKLAKNCCEKNQLTTLFIGVNSSELNRKEHLFQPLTDLISWPNRSISETMRVLKEEKPVKISLLLLTTNGSYFIPESTYKNNLHDKIHELYELGCIVYFIGNIKFQKADYLFE